MTGDDHGGEGDSLPERANVIRTDGVHASNASVGSSERSSDGGERSPRDRESRRALPDGGSAAGADDVTLDPWGSASVADYRKLFEQFGIEEFDTVLPDVPNPHYLMRRGVIFGHRDYGPVAEAMRNGDPFAVLSGWMPTGDPHIGHKLMIDEIVYHQEQGGDAYALVADLEAHSARGMTWADIDANTEEYLLSLLALGFDPEEGEIYRQSGNRRLQDLAFELGSEANFSEMQALYGFDGETNVSHMSSVITQMADILYPQLDEPKPTVIPVGPDQDPHVRLARDLAERMRFFKVTEAYASFEAEPAERELISLAYRASDAYAADPATPRCTEAAEWLDRMGDVVVEEVGTFDEPASAEQIAKFDISDDVTTELREAQLEVNSAVASFTLHDGARGGAIKKLRAAGKEPLRPRVRFLDRRATDEAFEALIGAVEGEKRVFEGHIDAFDRSRDEAETLAREVELDHGGHAFRAPSSIYHRFMTGLTGGKMSSSVPASHISLLDDPQEGYDKVTSATTGGRSTAEEQRELGGRADECPVYELYTYLLAGDDDEFATEVYEECVGGERLCGGCKEQAAGLMREFLADHQEKREEMRPVLESLDIDVESPRRRD